MSKLLLLSAVLLTALVAPAYAAPALPLAEIDPAPAGWAALTIVFGAICGAARRRRSYGLATVCC